MHDIRKAKLHKAIQKLTVYDDVAMLHSTDRSSQRNLNHLMVILHHPNLLEDLHNLL